MTVPPTVFHIDNDLPMRRRVEGLLRSVGLPVEGYVTVAQFLTAWQPDRPGCLMVDVQPHNQSALDLLGGCTEKKIYLPVIALSDHPAVSLAVKAMKKGALDFLEKPCSDQRLLDSVRHALVLDAQQREERTRHRQTAARLALLAPGERDVLQLMLVGKGYKVIAGELKVSYKTVEARRARVMQKMGCETLAELLAAVLSFRYWCASQPHGEQEGWPPEQAD